MSSPPAPPKQPASGLFRAEYARRMNAVLDHIDRHLDTPLDPATGEFSCDICIPVRPL
ncbi:hypothetical protein [Janthinobacterium sp. LM6]|uniref:hypothetical protein n=1 Tax=Janthinobacterium sp. LM6 TaxID=1938606 RepID=UPI0015C575D3|nr:hypothetical protein [Janthinobacterium sp. LM6]